MEETKALELIRTFLGTYSVAVLLLMALGVALWKRKQEQCEAELERIRKETHQE